MNTEVEFFLAKAERALQAAILLIDANDVENASSRVYYSMLHTAQALLRSKGQQYRKHGGVHGAYGEYFAKTGLLDPKFHRWMMDAFDERNRCDYDAITFFDAEDIRTRIQQAQEFLQAAKLYLNLL